MRAGSTPRQSAGGDYVLYWCQMNRRAECNQALDFALELANQLRVPVLYYEGLTYSYPYASDRFHTFILEGVPETARRLERQGIGYVFYLRRGPFDPNDVFYRLAARAAAIVTDDYPTFIAARHNAVVPAKLDVAYYAVDASCIVPDGLLREARICRLYHPAEDPQTAAGLLVAVAAGEGRASVSAHVHSSSTQRSPRKTSPALVAACEIDHTVAPSRAGLPGRAARRQRTAWRIS